MDVINDQHQHQNQSISIGDWLITMLITAIPVIGFIMLLVWAFSDGTNPSKKNWAIASLIFMVAGSVIAFLFFGSVIAAAMAAGASY